MEYGERNGGFVILGVIACALLLEAAWIVWRRRQRFDWRDAAASFGVGAIKRITDLGGAAVIAVVMAWGTDDPDADVNGDGIVSVLDLIAVVLSFGPC